MGLSLMKNHILDCWDSFSSKLDFCSYIGFTGKTIFKKIGTHSFYLEVLPSKIPLDLAWNIVIVPWLVLLIATGMWWINYRNNCCSTISWKMFILAVWKDSSNTRWRSTCYCDRLHDLFAMILRCYKDVNSFFTCTARLQNFLLAEFFHIMCDLNSFKSTLTHFTPLTSFCTPWVPSSGCVERD